MEKNYEIYLAPPLPPSCSTIQHISFSIREIDILACLFGRRTTKKIAAFLNLSPRTIENYIRNLTLKIGCSSREGIIEFVEQSDQRALLQERYRQLRLQLEFEKSLKNIATLPKVVPLEGAVIFEEESSSSMLSSFQTHLTMAGIKITSEESKHFSFNDLEDLKATFLIYVLSEATLRKLQEGATLSSVPPLPAHTPEIILYACLESSKPPNSGGIYHYIQEENYYFLVFDILKRLASSPPIDTVCTEFKKKYEQIKLTSPDPSFSNNLNRPKEVEEKSAIQKIYKKNNLARAFLLILIFAGVGLFMIKNGFKSKELISYQTGSPLSVPQSNTIRSDLSLPAEEVLLDRPALRQQIEEAFKGAEPIRLVALVGSGGAGKTTLARKIARAQSAPLIWEINAETKESLNRSFGELAQALVKTEEQKKSLKDIQEIQNPDMRSSKILLFVKDRLREQPNWFLLYDNVESLRDIRFYLPQEEEIWGRGKILITTRNSHMQNNASIRVLPINTLTPQEKLTLFTKILTDESSPLTPTQQIEMQRLLEVIPPFPLDVSVAAYYLRTTGISPEIYRQYLHIPNPNFIAWGEPHGLDQKSLKLSFSV